MVPLTLLFFWVLGSLKKEPAQKGCPYYKMVSGLPSSCTGGLGCLLESLKRGTWGDAISNSLFLPAKNSQGFIDAAHGKGSAEKLRVSSGDVGVYTSPAPYVPAMPGNMSLRRQATDPGFRRLRITTMCEMAQGRKSVRQQTVRTAGRPQQLRVQTTQQSIQESSEDASASSSSE